jgi:hypothetical protein
MIKPPNRVRAHASLSARRGVASPRAASGASGRAGTGDAADSRAGTRGCWRGGDAGSEVRPAWRGHRRWARRAAPAPRTGSGASGRSGTAVAADSNSARTVAHGRAAVRWPRRRGAPLSSPPSLPLAPHRCATPLSAAARRRGGTPGAGRHEPAAAAAARGGTRHQRGGHQHRHSTRAYQRTATTGAARAARHASGTAAARAARQRHVVANSDADSDATPTRHGNAPARLAIRLSGRLATYS